MWNELVLDYLWKINENKINGNFISPAGCTPLDRLSSGLPEATSAGVEIRIWLSQIHYYLYSFPLRWIQRIMLCHKCTYITLTHFAVRYLWIMIICRNLNFKHLSKDYNFFSSSVRIWEHGSERFRNMVCFSEQLQNSSM